MDKNNNINPLKLSRDTTLDIFIKYNELHMPMNALQVIAQILLWATILTGIIFLIPQIVKMYKNKFADNSSLLFYIFDVVCYGCWSAFELIYVLNTNDTGSQEAMLWIQFGGETIAFIISIYSLVLKLYYVLGAKTKATAKTIEVLKRRVNTSIFLTNEKEPMLKMTLALIKQYPQFVKRLNIHAKICKKSLEQYLESKNAVELAVINALILKKVLNRKANPIDVKLVDNYNKYNEYAINKINSLSTNYMDVISKAPLYQLKHAPKNQVELNAYVNNLQLVEKWVFLSQIYQSLLSI